MKKIILILAVVSSINSFAGVCKLRASELANVPTGVLTSEIKLETTLNYCMDMAQNPHNNPYVMRLVNNVGNIIKMHYKYNGSEGKSSGSFSF